MPTPCVWRQQQIYTGVRDREVRETDPLNAGRQDGAPQKTVRSAALMCRPRQPCSSM